MPKNDKISSSVIRRLPRYYRFLGELQKEGITKISSRELSERMKLTASQIRQDLNCFGGFGQQGYGYNVTELRNEIAAIIGVDKQLKAVLIGVGNLGRAVALHLNFEKCGCRLAGAFDSKKSLENTDIGELKIMHTSKIEEFCQREKPQLAILCIPKEGAKVMCEKLIPLGIKCFWNFSHYDINLDYEDIIVENVHMGDSLLTLAYRINNQ